MGNKVMSNEIIKTDNWWHSPAAHTLLAWEQRVLNQAVDDVFGYHAVQLGLPVLDALAENRMPHRWRFGLGAEAAQHADCHAVVHPAALPLDSASVDLLVLPHTLEQTALPHDCLREAARVLMPEGRVVITGLQPLSWWGAQFSLSRRVRRMRGLALSDDDLAQDTPATHQMIGRWRLRDWLALLDFEVQWQRVGVFRPPWQNATWQARLQGMEQWGARWAPWFGGAYVMVAVKRVVGIKRIRPAWQRASTRAQTARAVQRAPHP